MISKFKGVGVALVTPFDAAGKVDFAALETLVERVIEGGVDYIVALGTTAETPTLSHDERDAVAETIRRTAAGRLPLIMGKGGNDTAKLCAELRELDPTGWDAVLTITPYYNKPSQEGLFRHYRAVAQASPVPVVLYNAPGRTGVNMNAATTQRIAREVENVIAIKEACGDLEQIRQIIAGAPAGFAVISGDDGMTLPVLSAGGVGVISVLANAFPVEFSRVVHTAMEGDETLAAKLWTQLAPTDRLNFAEGNPTGVKTALSILGVCRADVRLPLVEGSTYLRAALEKAMAFAI